MFDLVTLLTKLIVKDGPITDDERQEFRREMQCSIALCGVIVRRVFV